MYPHPVPLRLDSADAMTCSRSLMSFERSLSNSSIFASISEMVCLVFFRLSILTSSNPSFSSSEGSIILAENMPLRMSMTSVNSELGSYTVLMGPMELLT